MPTAVEKKKLLAEIKKAESALKTVKDSIEKSIAIPMVKNLGIPPEIKKK